MGKEEEELTFRELLQQLDENLLLEFYINYYNENYQKWMEPRINFEGRIWKLAVLPAEFWKEMILI
jgi:hypothetical protein